MFRHGKSVQFSAFRRSNWASPWSAGSLSHWRHFGLQVRYGAPSRFMGAGLLAVVPILLYAFIQTGLAEELFFRGFLAKRLCASFGFSLGNAIQATVFALLHLLLFINYLPVLSLVAITLLTGINGWIMGWLNEQAAGGSVIPSWMLHSLANLLVALGMAFNVM